MSTIADKLSQILEIKSDIADAIYSKGIPINENTPFNEYANKINNISEYIRPLDRPEIPEYVPPNIMLPSKYNTYEAYILYGLTPDNNKICINSQQELMCTWGIDSNDEVPFLEDTTMYGGYTIENEFDYDSVDIEPNADGIKWLLIHIYTKDSNIHYNIEWTFQHHSSNVNLGYVYSCYYPIYEIYSYCYLNKHVNTNFLGPITNAELILSNLEIAEIHSCVPNEETLNLFSVGQECRNLRRLKFSNIINNNNFIIEHINYFLYNCIEFDDTLEWLSNKLITQTASIYGVMQNCSKFNSSLIINLSNVQNIAFASFLLGGSSFNSVLILNTPLLNTILQTYTIINELVKSKCIKLINAPLMNFNSFEFSTNCIINSQDGIAYFLNVNISEDDYIDIINLLPDRTNMSTGLFYMISSLPYHVQNDIRLLSLITSKNWTFAL